MTFDIMHPEEVPTMKIFRGLASYRVIAHFTMLARPLLSPLPWCMSVLFVATSQQLLSLGELGYKTTKPLDSARALYLVV